MSLVPKGGYGSRESPVEPKNALYKRGAIKPATKEMALSPWQIATNG